MPWMKVSLNVAQNKLGLIEETMLRHDALSLTLSSVGNESALELTLHEVPKWSHIRVEALFPLHDDIQAVINDVRTIETEALDIQFVGDDEWKGTSEVPLEPKDFGGLWVVSRKARTSDLKNVIRLEPGLAFGTGEHPTTSMCLSWLAKHPPYNKKVLDFGTGSGILSIAAKKLGARTVDAIDIDVLARETACENARYNDVEVLIVETIPVGRRYDLILANVLLNTILQFAPILTTCLSPGGTILLTGLLPNQIDRVKSKYPAIEFEELVRQEEWRMMIGNSRPTNFE
ncbi:MAG: methyltransferase domain-containing protein [Gammaproteobacteria bacterium]|nr:methyltransferase domain-containing protein [Gammaproteobacteria bacterium]MYI77461.1 methyltransferase domain-containing protein [Gammaproteobacteria bacterium]